MSIKDFLAIIVIVFITLVVSSALNNPANPNEQTIDKELLEVPGNYKRIQNTNYVVRGRDTAYMQQTIHVSVTFQVLNKEQREHLQLLLKK